MAAPTSTNSALIASATSKSWSSSRVDRERQRLGHSLQAAREDDRRSELSEAAGERERRSCSEPANGQRQRDAPEDAPRARPERACRCDQVRIDAFEGCDRPPHVEGALDERDREDDRRLREADADPERVQLLAE